MKPKHFQPIKESFGKRCSVWNEKFMSMAAKETLIKSVAQAIPTYAMGVFKFNDGFHEDYMRIIRNFWWGGR